MNRQESMTDKHETQITKHIHKESSALEQSVKQQIDWRVYTCLTVPTSPLL